MSKQVWFILGGLWLVVVGGCFLWYDHTMIHTLVEAACSGNDPESHANCIAKYASRAWKLLLKDQLIWIAAPALVLAAVGVLVRKRA